MVAGNVRTFARLDNLEIKCWGRNADGELGLGDTVQRGSGPNQMGDNLPATVIESSFRLKRKATPSSDAVCGSPCRWPSPSRTGR